MFKTTCDEFLSTITSMRTKAITEAVERAIIDEHAPYAEQMTIACNAAIAEEEKKTEDFIANLRKELARKVEVFKADAQSAIADNKKRVTEFATTKAKEAYDHFILGVGKLVDETNIK